MVASVPLAITLFILYSVGSIALLITNTAIVKHIEWKTLPGVLLIVSLGISDTITALRGFVGSIEYFMNRELWPGSGDLLGVIGNFSFSCSSYHMILLAYNRFIGVCIFWKFKQYAGPGVTKGLITVVWCMSLVYCLVHRFVLCCNVVWDFEIISSRYNRDRNETNVLISLDLYAYTYCTTMIPSVLYVFVFLKLLFMHQQEQVGTTNNQIDVKLCIQFFIIIGVYLAWNLVWKAKGAWVPIVVGILGCLNCVINPFVYLVFNPTIRNAVKTFLGMNGNIVAPSSGVANGRPPNGRSLQVGHA